MTSTFRVQAQGAVGLAVAALMLLLASPAQASEVVGTLSSNPAPSSTITGTVTGGSSGSTATGTITGGSGNTITGTVSGGDTGGGGGGGGGSLRRGGSASTNNNGEVLGASTDPGGVGGGFGTPDVPGAPNAGTGPSSFIMVLLLGLAAIAAAGTFAARRFAR